jgi:hypothetical protein
MSNAGGVDDADSGAAAKRAPDAGAAARPNLAPPAALSPDAAKQFESLQRPLKPAGTAGANSNNP